MSRVRFATARDLFDAFPSAVDDVGAEPDDRPALEFLESLITDDTLDKAVSYCAYLLPRRESVWWGCHSVRYLVSHSLKHGDTGLRLAEDWVHEPEESRRFAALGFGEGADRRFPTTWLALAAGWSAGGGLTSIPGSASGSHNQTARGVRAAVLMAAAYSEAAERLSRLAACVQNGARFAAGGELQT